MESKVNERVAEIAGRAEKATKGPWEYQEESDAYTHIVRQAGTGIFICHLAQETSGESEANARLIASVPYLLVLVGKLARALEAIRDGDEKCGCEDHVSPDCCNNVNEYCPECIAGAALAERAEG